MDRYDRLIRDVQGKTEGETLHWRVVLPQKYSEILVNAHRVVRAFEADYSVGGKPYLLLFIERKSEYYEDRGEVEGIAFELFVLDQDGQIVIPLYDGVVDRDDLFKLSGLVEAHNDRARDFFAAFEKSGTA